VHAGARRGLFSRNREPSHLLFVRTSSAAGAALRRCTPRSSTVASPRTGSLAPTKLVVRGADAGVRTRSTTGAAELARICVCMA